MVAERQATAWPPTYDRAFIPPASAPYWDAQRETMEPEARDAVILAKIQGVMAWAWERAPFYKRRWQAAGLEPGDIKSLADFRGVPAITKADLRTDQAEHPPFGSYLCIDPGSIVRMHGTSGTSGRPTAFAWSAGDFARIGEAHAHIMWSMGIRPADTVFVGSIFSLYVGSWGALAGTERLGAAAFPFGAGVPGMTALAIGWIKQMRPAVFYGTPSYALRLAEQARKDGTDPASLGLRIMFFSGEPGAGIPSMKRTIERAFGTICIDSGSMGEVTPWMNLAECSHRTGMHLWQDFVYTEVLEPETMQPVPFGGTGTPVYTTLERETQPMIRLISGDLAEWTGDPCPCGRTYPRFPRGIIGRMDDMIIVRGENIYPTAIEDVLRTFAELDSEFQIVLRRERQMDELVIRTELRAPVTDPDAFADTVAAALRRVTGVRPVVEFCESGSLSRTELKSRRVRDDRPKE